MATLTIVIGLPGSGKSYFLDRLVNNGTLPEERTCADYFRGSKDNILEVPRSPFFEPMISSLKRELDCAIADISFCEVRHLRALVATVLAEVPTVTIKRIYFRNDLDACRRNVWGSANEAARLAEIERLSHVYVIPSGEEAREVFKKPLGLPTR